MMRPVGEPFSGEENSWFFSSSIASSMPTLCGEARERRHQRNT
jgi:hypothetical protein